MWSLSPPSYTGCSPCGTAGTRRVLLRGLWPAPGVGYFDHPPLVPMLARVASLGGLLGLRALAIAIHLACIALAALLAAEFGGGGWRR